MYGAYRTTRDAEDFVDSLLRFYRKNNPASQQQPAVTRQTPQEQQSVLQQEQFEGGDSGEEEDKGSSEESTELEGDAAMLMAEVESLLNYGKFTRDTFDFVKTKCKVAVAGDKVWSIYNKYLSDMDRDDFIDSITRYHKQQLRRQHQQTK